MKFEEGEVYEKVEGTEKILVLAIYAQTKSQISLAVLYLTPDNRAKGPGDVTITKSQFKNWKKVKL